MDALADWQDEWELVLTHERKVADLSRVTYVRAVRQLRAFLAERHPTVTTPGQVTARHVGEFLSGMADEGRGQNTLRIRLKSLRLWFGYLATQDGSGVVQNPAAGVALPEESLPPVPVIPDGDLTGLLQTMAGPTFIDRRDTAIIRMLLDTGVRRGELVGIDVADLDLQQQEVTLHRTKGGRPRIVPFGGKTAIALRKYLRARDQRRAGRESPALFLSARWDGAGDGRMTGGGVGEMLTRRCAVAGMDPIHAHQFRHTWADDLLSHGANEGDVERLAGWRSPLMVRRYGRSVADRRARDSARRLARGDRV
ncbi:tyrosine-type recombinase/integrase [Pseudonocardia broussonetiae]|uniref:Tyrosine-type recombinase/integrase n=1 Tax=Pseudonocardia broussonetiae TaxID=2736640 RepID=A0A6M6JJ49_9PSEU|nr:tyrosine-type recombinase/integrase [Pseudonocardia broussonetiae]QJY46937.1 tyrosine-type recombinase/integrase [Pseudonocardia broussonetiae]